VPRQARGNSNWGKAMVFTAEAPTPSAFEMMVKSLRLAPSGYIKSEQLREWVRANKEHRYVPPELLKAWGFEVKGDV